MRLLSSLVLRSWLRSSRSRWGRSDRVPDHSAVVYCRCAAFIRECRAVRRHPLPVEVTSWTTQHRRPPSPENYSATSPSMP